MAEGSEHDHDTLDLRVTHVEGEIGRLSKHVDEKFTEQNRVMGRHHNDVLNAISEIQNQQSLQKGSSGTVRWSTLFASLGGIVAVISVIGTINWFFVTSQTAPIKANVANIKALNTLKHTEYDGLIEQNSLRDRTSLIMRTRHEMDMGSVDRNLQQIWQEVFPDKLYPVMRQPRQVTE